MSLRERIKTHEGRRFEPYEDSLGVLTVGYGRNLRDVPFSQDEIDLMFENDLNRARDGALSIPAYHEMNELRRGVLIEMVFQMGASGVSNFKNFLSACMHHDWARAAEDFRQGPRANFHRILLAHSSPHRRPHQSYRGG